MIKNDDLTSLAESVGLQLSVNNWTLTVVESCTGGWISKVLTSVPGSSAWFYQGLVTYSNDSKISLARVPEEVISAKGAVSAEVAECMASNIVLGSDSSVGVGVTGVAGPSGGTSDKPVGTVFIAWKLPKTLALSRKYNFSGSRDEIRYQSVKESLNELFMLLK